MNDLFAPPPAENVMSKQFRVHPVIGDGMAPALRSNWDYVLLKPTSEYCGEGIYLLHDGYGPVLYRIQSFGGSKLLMKLDNPAYDTHRIMTKCEFEANVLAYVVADIKVRDERFFREAA
jgi:hypothetical protein